MNIFTLTSAVEYLFLSVISWVLYASFAVLSVVKFYTLFRV
jgi:hypothetical protein